MRHPVCVVTGSRADFGILCPLLLRLQREPSIELRLAVTGSHLMQALGETLNEIEESGIPIHAKISFPMDGDSKYSMAKVTGAVVSSFADYFSAERPELLVILGDRFEIFAASTAAALMGIPIAHISGGDTTIGAVDEFLRHSITKMSILHFVGCADSKRRVIQLGESPDRVFDVGEPGLENLISIPPVSKEKLREDIGFPREGRAYAVVTFHPVTLEEHSGKKQIGELIQAMDRFPDLDFIVTLSNVDAGGQEINRIWKQESSSRQNWLVIPSLGAKRYVSAVRNAEMVIGNSSSGIIEAPFFHVPTVNIGNRQKGRIMVESVICCKPDAEDIASAIRLAMAPDFKELAAKASRPFGDGHTSEKILPIILDFLTSGNINMKKSFFDVQFEV